MVTTERQIETHDEAMHRLAKQAQDKGVSIGVYVPRGEYFASSISHPGELHRVTLVSCDCQGFMRHQRCQHHSALLAELGELPALPEPPTEPIGPLVRHVGGIECLECRACGVLSWRGSIVFDGDRNAAYCYECAPVALAA